MVNPQNGATKKNEISVYADTKSSPHLQDILMKEKEYSIESSVQYTIPAFWDGNPKLLMVFTNGKKDCWKETRDFHFSFFFFFLSFHIA